MHARRFLLLVFAVAAPMLFADEPVLVSDAMPMLGRRIATRITELRGENDKPRPVLRLIYFHASDQEPLKDYESRWRRIMDDIRVFYRDEMKRNGFGATTFDYERDADGAPKFHVVRGRHPSSRYSYDTGQEIREEARDAIGEAFDLETSYTLFIHGLCDELDDGSFRIHAPYYGEGGANWQGGICHVADCPKLDVALLGTKGDRVRYWEHTGRFDQSLSDFNTKYLGGVAHELGHGFGLPHNRERTLEHQSIGTALMGSGNHTYRREVWSDKRGSFLTSASAISLAIHPLFSGFDASHETHPTVKLDDGHFNQDTNPPMFEGKIECEVDPIAVIVYADPEGNSNYDAYTAVAEVVDGRFDVPLDFDRLRDGEFRLLVCLVNGAVLPLWKAPLETADGGIDFESMVGRVLVSKIEKMYFGERRDEAIKFAAEVAQEYRNANQAELFNSVASLSTADSVIPLSGVQGMSVSLADVEWVAADVGWRTPARNFYPDGRGNGADRFLSIDGKYFFRGLYAHAPSRYAFDLNGLWTSFETTIGFQDGGNSEAVWIVLGDGRELMRSKPIKSGRHERRIVDVAGVKRLELVVESSRPTNANCWTVWGNPRLTR